MPRLLSRSRIDVVRIGCPEARPGKQRGLAALAAVFIPGDTKDEFEPMCRARGVEPFVIGHRMAARVNPLAFGPLGHLWSTLDGTECQRRAAVIFSRWLVLIRGLVGSQRVRAAGAIRSQ